MPAACSVRVAFRVKRRDSAMLRFTLSRIGSKIPSGGSTLTFVTTFPGNGRNGFRTPAVFCFADCSPCELFNIGVVEDAPWQLTARNLASIGPVAHLLKARVLEPQFRSHGPSRVSRHG